MNSSIDIKLTNLYLKLLGTIRNREFCLTLLSQFVQLSSGMLLVKILTSQLELIEYGSFSLIMSVSAFVLTIPFTAIQQGFYRYRSIYNRKKMGASLYTSMICGVLGLISIYVLLVKFSLYFINIGDFWLDSFGLISLFVLTEVFKIFTRCIVNADRKRTIYAYSILIEFTFKLSLTIVISYLEDLSVDWVLASYSFANFLSIFISCIEYKKEFKRVNLRHLAIIWKKVIIFSSPLLLWAGFGWSRDMSTRWFLEVYTDTDVVAVYSVLGSLCLIIPTILQSVIGAYLIPILYERASNSKSSTPSYLLLKIQTYLLYLGSFLLVLVILFSKEIILLISTLEYVQHSWALPWMFTAYYLYICGMIRSSTFLISMQPKKLLLPNVVSGVITLILGPTVIKFYGFEGAVFSYVITYSSYFILVQVAMKMYGNRE